MSSKQRSRNEIISKRKSSSINGCRRRSLKTGFLDSKTLKKEAEVGGKDLGVLEKLEALKNLIPSKTGEVKVDQLFEETADYIVFLKTQVGILQKLIDFYGSSSPTSNDQDNHKEEEEVVSQ